MNSNAPITATSDVVKSNTHPMRSMCEGGHTHTQGNPHAEWVCVCVCVCVCHCSDCCSVSDLAFTSHESCNYLFTLSTRNQRTLSRESRRPNDKFTALQSIRRQLLLSGSNIEFSSFTIKCHGMMMTPLPWVSRLLLNVLALFLKSNKVIRCENMLTEQK